MDYSQQIGETLAETLSELFVIEDMNIPLNEIRDLKTLKGHLKAAESKYGKKHPKYQALQNLHAKKEAAEQRKKERMGRIKQRQEFHAKNYGYKRVKGTNDWTHESGHKLTFGDDRSWSHVKAGGKRPKGGNATPIRDLKNHLKKLHEEVVVAGDELNEIRRLPKLSGDAYNRALLGGDTMKLQKILALQRRKRNIMMQPEEEEKKVVKKLKKVDHPEQNTIGKVCPECNNYDDECTCKDE